MRIFGRKIEIEATLSIGDMLRIAINIIAIFIAFAALMHQIKDYQNERQAIDKKQLEASKEQNSLLEKLISYKELKGIKLVVGNELIIDYASGVSIELLSVNQAERGLAKLHIINGGRTFDEIVKKGRTLSVKSEDESVRYEFRILEIPQEGDWIRIHIHHIPL